MSDAIRTFSSTGRLMLGRLGLFRSRRGARPDQPDLRGPRGQLFHKYVFLFIGLVSLVMLINGALDFWFSYRANRAALVLIQQEKADAVAQRIAGFFDEILGQISWTTHAQWATDPLELRRRDFARLMRQVPPIIELIQLDHSGIEQLKVSRPAGDVVGSGADYARESSFTEAVARRVWFGPVRLCKDSEPCMTVAKALAGGNAGVIVAEVDLKPVWDVITALKIGQDGYAFIVDRDGRLIAHPDAALAPRDTDLSALLQVMAAHDKAGDANAPNANPRGEQSAAPRVTIGKGIDGQSVLTANAVINPLSWFVFVEVPLKAALGPLYSSGLRTAGLLAFALGLAALAALFLARRMVVPIQLMQAGAARFGAGEFDRRIEIHTGDELEGLADEFNRMAGDLQKSYAELEKKVEERTVELKEALDVIADSIEYASRIQRTVLPEPNLVSSILSDHFILWEPRDVVSGDVYWLTRWGDGVLIALGDCTGHGVPGAFVTLIASGALERAQLEVDPGGVGRLISRMNQIIQVSMKQTTRGGESDDGIELGMCYISPDHSQLIYAGAGFSLFCAPPTEDLVEIKGDKYGIGYSRTPFDQIHRETNLRVVPGMRFYMTSDGLIDQIGGERRRGFGRTRFLALLNRHKDSLMADQKTLLVNALKQYQGTELRRDDISVLGFRL